MITVTFFFVLFEDIYKNILKRNECPCGLDYLEKIVQMPYHVSVGINMENFIGKLMGDFKEGNVEEDTADEPRLNEQNKTSEGQEKSNETENNVVSSLQVSDSSGEKKQEYLPDIILKFDRKELADESI